MSHSCSYAPLCHLLGLCWRGHSRLDERRIPAHVCRSSWLPGPASVCGAISQGLGGKNPEVGYSRCAGI